jgi:hypothetical protein
MEIIFVEAIGKLSKFCAKARFKIKHPRIHHIFEEVDIFMVRPLRSINVETERGKFTLRLDMRAKVTRAEFFDLQGNKVAEVSFGDEEYLRSFRDAVDQVIRWLEFWRKG